MTQSRAPLFVISKVSDAISHCREIMESTMQSMFQKWLMQQAIHRYDNMIHLVSFYVFIHIMIFIKVTPVLREVFVVLK